MMNENNDVFTMEDEPIASVVQDMRKGSKWLSAFLESYRPPLDGERYLTDGEVAELGDTFCGATRLLVLWGMCNQQYPAFPFCMNITYVCRFSCESAFPTSHVRNRWGL